MYLQLKKALFTAAILLLACCFLTTQSEAGTIALGNPVALSTLLSTPNTNPTIQVGDKLFDTFTYTKTGDMPSAVNVNVVPIQDSDGNYGIRFQAAFIDMPGDGGSDSLINYKVTVTDPEPRRIIDAHLVGNPNLLGGTGSASITETFMDESPLTMEIHDNGGTPKMSDSVNFPLPGFRSLNVQKDILLFGGDAPATLSFADQTFSQTPGDGVPEASAAAMTLIACAGFGIKRRRVS